MQEERDQETSEERVRRGKLTPREFPGYKIKKAAMIAALDIRLARMYRSPERCARNLIELGLGSFPDKLSEEEQFDILQELMLYCRAGDSQKARELFIERFLR